MNFNINKYRVIRFLRNKNLIFNNLPVIIKVKNTIQFSFLYFLITYKIINNLYKRSLIIYVKDKFLVILAKKYLVS